jgi:hypothetical protein
MKFLTDNDCQQFAGTASDDLKINYRELAIIADAG